MALRVLIEREKTLDEAVVHVEVTAQFQQRIGEEAFHKDTWTVHEELQRLHHKVSRVLQEALGLLLKVRISTTGTLPRSEGKAVRIVDLRK